MVQNVIFGKGWIYNNEDSIILFFEKFIRNHSNERNLGGLTPEF
jgi:hypothetical protein